MNPMTASTKQRMQAIGKAVILATAIGSSGGTAAWAQDAGSSGQSTYIVMVEFPVKTGESEAVVATVRSLLDTIVHKQDGFQFARIHREIDGGKVINESPRNSWRPVGLS